MVSVVLSYRGRAATLGPNPLCREGHFTKRSLFLPLNSTSSSFKYHSLSSRVLFEMKWGKLFGMSMSKGDAVFNLRKGLIKPK